MKTLKACSKLNLKKYIIYPNYDPGYLFIINSIKRLKIKFIFFKNIDRQDFLKLVINAQALIGNSSAGILESPSLGGCSKHRDGQNYREQNNNIFNAKYNIKDIYSKILKAINIKNKIGNIKIFTVMDCHQKEFVEFKKNKYQ